MRFPPRWFSFLFATSDREARGIIALLILIVIMIGVRIAVSYSIQTPSLDISVTVLDSLSDILDKKKTDKYHSKISFSRPSIPFDPNKASRRKWIQLGLDTVVSGRIEKYLERGGNFKTTEDLKKIYGLPSWFYDSVSTFLVFNDLDPVPYRSKHEFEDKKDLIQIEEKIEVDLNLADSSELTEVKGIGPTYASRIIRYRDQLGGFFVKDQLLEVYGIDSTVYSGLESQLFVDTTAAKIQRIRLNTVDFKSLLRNPYLDYDQVKAIINFRDQHVQVRKKDFLGFPFLSDQAKSRLLPYLDFSLPI